MTMLKIATVEKESLYLNQLLKKNFGVFKNIILVFHDKLDYFITAK